MKYAIKVKDKYDATVELVDDGDHFTGTIDAGQFGSGVVSGIHQGAIYSGTLELMHHKAVFSAIVDGKEVSGTIQIDILFISEVYPFHGTALLPV